MTVRINMWIAFVSSAENPYIKDRLTRLAEDGSQKMRSTVSHHHHSVVVSYLLILNVLTFLFVCIVDEGCYN